MPTDLDTRLSAHFAEVATRLSLPETTLDEVLADAARTPSPIADRAIGAGPTAPFRWAAVAAAGLLVVGAVAVIARRGDESGGVAVDRPSALLAAVDEIAPDEWVIAGPLPPGVVYMYALGVDGDASDDRSVAYGNERASGTFERIRISIDDRPAPVVAEVVEVAGTEWLVDASASGRWTATRRLGTTNVTISDSGPFDGEARRIVAGLVVVPVDELPHEPLGESASAVDVARFDLDGVVQSFAVQESNRYWCTWVRSVEGESGGCGTAFDDAAAVTVGGGFSEVADGADTAEVVRAGTVSTDSARVELEFGDGTVVEATPTDLSGRFDRKFWIAGAIVRADGRSVVAVRSFDADGRLLGVATPPFE